MYPKHAIAKMLEGHDKDDINFVLIGKFNKDFPYIVNHTKRICRQAKCPPCPDDWTIHPLSLLTASGNGQGGGDFMETVNTLEHGLEMSYQSNRCLQQGIKKYDRIL